jgi:guanylate kinase
MDKKRGKIFFFSGPSGVGKGTLIGMLRESHPEWKFPPSCTTRDPRPGETDGETYYFLSKEEFLEKIDNDEFLEWAEVHHENWYGTLKKPLLEPIEQGEIVVREFDVQGFAAAREKLDREDFVSIFLKPAGGVGELVHRIRDRAPISDKDLALRMESMKSEFAQARLYDHEILVEDGNFEKMRTDAEKIIFSALKK